jgi:hypothetical protein
VQALPDGEDPKGSRALKGAPCKVCDRRRLGCHSECDDYKSWKAEVDAISASKARERNAKPEICKQMERFIWKGWKK